MPEYQTPGVYVEEIQLGPRPIEGVPTATAAFIGETERGPVTPTHVTSEADYRSWFGGSFGDGDRYMSHAVHGFFANGGQRLHVCRVVGANAADGAGVDDFIGQPTATRAEPQGLAALGSAVCRDVALIHAPHPARDAPAIARALIAHCEQHRFRFAVIDGGRGESSIAALDPRTTLAYSSFAAFYHPWLQTTDPMAGTPMLVPPGGHVLGIYARIDTERGVFKAPANEVVRGIVDLEFSIGKEAQEVLNPRGVNLIRRFEGRGIRVWGARTLSSDPQWKYVPVRRLFIFIERSIQQGTQWAVFEPNDASLWERVQDAVRLFLRTQWRAGALLGATEQQAFFVRCDRTTMTQNDMENGRLVCEVGIAPLRPAEFVIFRIVQQTADAQR